MAILIPKFIDTIFDQPGKEWSEVERSQVIEWLFGAAQFNYLIGFCLTHIGPRPLHEDAEDMWAEFCASRLTAVLHTYDPAKKRRFWNYLLFCLERECGHLRRKLNDRAAREIPLEITLNIDESEFEKILAWDDTDPTALIESRERLEKLHRCLAALPPHQRLAFLLVEIEEMSYAEAAAQLKELAGTVRVWCYRARQALRLCMSKGEFMP